MDGSNEAAGPGLAVRDSRALRLFAVAMIRNESDIIVPFLRHCAELFDEILVADIQSTDGTDAAIRGFSDPNLRVRVYDVDRQEKYQSALMNCLSREAFAEGADWVFFLDADEFLDVADRAELERYLREFGSDVMMAPWINLVPTRYGNYDAFDPTQTFFWSGRTSQFTKVALSSLFATSNPDYFVNEGNHTVSPAPTSPPIFNRPGLALLHVPIRSLDRFKLKIGAARRLMRTKHNRLDGEGIHVDELDDLLSGGGVDPAELNFIAANYGEKAEEKHSLDPVDLGWPARRLPPFVSEALGGEGGQFKKLSETLLADTRTVWDQTPFVRGTPVGAVIDGKHIRIVPQPVTGGGYFHSGRFAALGPTLINERAAEDLLVDVVGVASLRVKAVVFSAWSELIPVLYALFVLLRPRRFVELGVHNGMSFFAACQIAEQLGLLTECVGVDSWVGDKHAGFHTSDVFDDFRAHLRANYPHQHYIQAYFSAATGCFENGSIDLLHIDGLHTYEAVKEDFDIWLPKLSDAGVVIFHDINVYERGFGVWRLWEELRVRYPAYGFAHKHGLGIIYVGREPHPFASLLRLLAENRHYSMLAQAYFEGIGTLLIENSTNLAALERVSSSREGDSAAALAAEREVVQDLLRQRAALNEHIANQQKHIVHQQNTLNTVLESTSWHITAPMRRILGGQPKVRRTLRRALKLVWWSLTFKLPRRLREERRAMT